MTPQQLIDFDARREAVLREHMKTSPKFRALRRDRRVAFAASVVRYGVAVGIMLFLLKAFVISQSGTDGYLATVQPLLSQLPAGSLLAQSVAPDPYSAMLANTFSDLTAPDTQSAQNALDGFSRVGPATSEF